MKIRGVVLSDAGSIAAIYNHFVIQSAVTFEESEVLDTEIAIRIETVRSSGLPWYVATESERLIGYAFATPWKARSAYRYSAEVTVYVSPERFGEGIGTALYRTLLPSLRSAVSSRR